MIQEKRARGDRGRLRKTISEVNPVGARIRFVRESLGLSSTEVCNATNIPAGCYSNRENGTRTTFYEEILVLAIYFDHLWQRRYAHQKHFPKFQDVPVDRVTPMWLFFGRDPNLEEAKEIMSNIQEDYRRREIEYLERQLDLEAQLDMFQRPQDQEKRRQELQSEIEKSKNTCPLIKSEIG